MSDEPPAERPYDRAVEELVKSLLDQYAPAREQLEQSVTTRRGEYLDQVLSIESVLSELLIDLIDPDEQGEKILTDVFLDRVPGGDRLALFEQLRKTLGVSAETKRLSTKLSEVVAHRNDLAHRRPVIGPRGDALSFKGRKGEVTASELLWWQVEALEAWKDLRLFHARIVLDRRPERAQPWMEPFIERWKDEPPLEKAMRAAEAKVLGEEQERGEPAG